MIEKCVTSLASQTYPQFEVIVVDDGSTDDTADYLAGVADKHPSLEFRWFCNQPQAGANAARNRGVQASRGSYIAFLDDDCVAEPRWLERMMAGFTLERIGALAGTVVDPTPESMVQLFFRGSFYVYSPDGVSATRLVGCNMAIRRDLLLRFGLDEDRARVDSDVSVSGRGDESSLFHLIRAAGYEVRVVREAGVFHDHPHSWYTLVRQAYRSGGAAARLIHKYRLKPPLELLTLATNYALLPTIWISRYAWLPIAAVCLVFLVGLIHSERSRKQKTIREALVVLPTAVVYYHLRLVGYLMQWIRLRLQLDVVDRPTFRGSH